jgi:integrase/recombinase XerC
MEQPATPISKLEAARLLLQQMGVSPADLISAQDAALTPSFADFVPRVAKAVSAGTRSVYGPYWNRVVSEWGSRPIGSVTVLEVSQLAEQTKNSAVQRRNARGGRVAAEHLIGALRCMYAFAVASGIPTGNPAAGVAKPARLRSARIALPDSRLSEIFAAAGTTGDDPALDALLLRLHAETACRRGGALDLLPDDLDEGLCLIRLREKGQTIRWQPVSPTLMRHLRSHGETRGGLEPGRRLLRRANGTPISHRRYRYLWNRLGEQLPWVRTQNVSMHWIRHTTLTWVERRYGYAVAAAYAGHESSSHPGQSTTTYITAGLPEVATALAALTGEPHPLAIESLL